MTATLCVSPGHADRRTFSSHSNSAERGRSLQHLVPLNSCTQFDGRPSEVCVVPLDCCDFFQVVSPDCQAPGSGGTAQVVMASVPDDQADVLLPGEIDSGSDVVGSSGVHGIADICAQLTWALAGSPRVTALVGKEGGHHTGA